MIDPKIWEDQAEFNAQMRPLPETHAERVALIKEFTLHQMTEMAEFLDAAQVFGAHRRLDTEPLVNHANVKRQLIDQFKYWMSLCQMMGYTPADMGDTYWKKTATVRQRYVAERLTTLTKPVALIDLDGVLADFIEGFIQWIFARMNPSPQAAERLRKIYKTREFINATSLGVSIPEWEAIQHEFRTTGQFGELPMMPHAQEFVQFCREQGCHVVVITSRPIDQYPNIYDDTVEWFAKHEMKVDKIWWGPNKAEKLASVKHLIPDIQFAVDDDDRYIEQFHLYGVRRVYWYRHGELHEPPKQKEIVVVSSLLEIMNKEEHRHE